MSRYFYSFVFCLLSAASFYAQTTLPKDDFQFWTDLAVYFPIFKTKDAAGRQNDKIAFFINGTLRVGRNVSRPVDERIGLGFEFYVNKYLIFSPQYLYRAGQPYNRRHDYEHQLRLDLSAGKKWSGFSLRNRSRIEYHFRNSRPDSVLYRNRLVLAIPLKKKKKEIFTPFVSTEPHYDFNEKKWTRNEFSAGIGRTLARNFSADFYYLLQSNRGNVLRTVNAFGVSFKIKVD